MATGLGVALQGMGNGVVLVQQGASGPTFPAVAHSVFIYQRNTTTPVQVYGDSGLTTPLVTLGNAVTTGADGSIPGYVAAGQSLDAYDQTQNQTKQLNPIDAGSVGTVVTAYQTGAIVTDSSVTPVSLDSTGYGPGQTTVFDAVRQKLVPGTLPVVGAPKGVWSGATTYAIGDSVSGSNGHTYIAQQGTNLNHDPTTAGNRPTWWVDSLPASATFTAIGSTPPGSGVNNEAFGATAGAALTTGHDNAIFGKAAGLSLTTGLDNALFGKDAGRNLTSVTGATLVGYQAGLALTTGTATVLGFAALSSETTGVGGTVATVAIGSSALLAQSGAQFNTATGTGAGYSTCQGLANIGSRGTANAITSGSFNTIYGAASGPNVTTQLQGTTILGACSRVGGDYSMALGTNVQTTFKGIVAIGTDATGAGASIGIQNAFVLGTSQHMVHVPGTITTELTAYERDSIIATGASSGTFTASFTWNANTYTTAGINWNASAAAVQSALLAATRSGGTAFSTDAGADAVVCYGGPLPSTAVTVVFQHKGYGPVSAQSCNNGALVGGTAAFTQAIAGILPVGNEGFGYWAVSSITSGFSNTGVGRRALLSCTTGTRNTAVGEAALGLVLTGNFNTALGSNALAALDLGPTGGLSAGNDGEGAINCVAVGAYAGSSLTSPRHSITAVGTYALQNDVGGGQSTAIGDKALRSQNGVTRVEPISGLTAYGSFNVALGTGAGYTSATGYSDVDHTRVTGGSFNTNKQTTTGIAQTLIGFYSTQASATQSNGISTLGAFSQAGDGNGSSNGWYATALGYATSAGAAGAVAIGCDHTGAGASTLVQDQIKLGTSLHSIQAGGVFFPVQAATGSAPAYVKGGMYFNTTTNKLMIGGASAWETVTSV